MRARSRPRSVAAYARALIVNYFLITFLRSARRGEKNSSHCEPLRFSFFFFYYFYFHAHLYFVRRPPVGYGRAIFPTINYSYAHLIQHNNTRRIIMSCETRPSRLYLKHVPSTRFANAVRRGVLRLISHRHHRGIQLTRR